MSKEVLLSAFDSQDWVKYNKKISKLCGLEAAVMLGNLIDKYLYWKRNTESYEKTIGHPFDGSFFDTRENIENDIGISAHLQRKGESALVEKGILSIVRTKAKQEDCKTVNTYIIHFDILENILSTNIQDVNIPNLKPLILQNQNCSYSDVNRFDANKNKQNNNKLNNNSSTTKAESKAELSAPVSRQQHLTTLYNKYIPGIKLRKSDIQVLESLDKVEEYLPYLPYFDEKYWNTTTKHPSILPHVWIQLQSFVENFTNTSAFHTLCKELKRQGVDVESIIEQAETISKGKQEIVRRYL